MFTFGSLFAGIGGIDLGFERAGMTCQWQVEIDDYASKVLQKHWPHVARFRDVRECGSGNLSPVDCIAGGFPCQDISYAGRGAGLAGARSGLWYEFARIIRELQPKYVFVENVSALLRRGLSDVLGSLASLGYDAEWHCLQAADIGAPHTRDRLFIIAYSHKKRCKRGELPIVNYDIPHYEEWHAAKDCKKWETWQYWIAQTVQDGLWSEPNASVLGMAHGLPADMERIGVLGNAVVPQVAEFFGHCILRHAQGD